jgi:exosome complex exonuclease DIS3/RRP44
MFAVLRRHPAPKAESLLAMQKLLASRGYRGFAYGSNKELGASLDKCVSKNDPFFNTCVRIMTTRSMNQAVYFCTGDVSPDQYAHYGLAMGLYTHFTSPIRRYADVLVHRFLMASMGLHTLPDSLQDKTKIMQQCDTINLRNRMAQWSGRASADLHTFLYFDKVGTQEARAIVTKVRKNGLQVMVPRYGIEGVAFLEEEEWTVNEEAATMTRKSDGLAIGVFNKVEVRISATNKDFRYKTVLEFLGVTESSAADDREDKRARTAIEKEMYPDRLAPGEKAGI